MSRPHSVLIAGGGPTGMMLAAELTLAGVDVAIVERQATREFTGSHAGGLHARTIEVFDMRGIADRFLAQGEAMQILGFNSVRLDISDFPTRYPYGLALWQKRTEGIMARWIEELGVPVYNGREVVAFAQSDDSVDVEISDGTRVRAEYLVGCDGGRSIVRKTAGIDFPGWDATTSWLMAEVDFATEPPWGMRADGNGGIGKADGGQARLVLVEREVASGGQPTLRDLRELLTWYYGTDYGVDNPKYLSRFTDATRQAATYRKGRVLLAGDAAHIHPPMGGQGLNIGVQDAVNLGWKLAQVVNGISPESLLDSYHSERHPIAARVLKNTMAQVALRRTDERTKALGEVVAELLAMDEPRKRLAAEMSGLGVHYALGEGHPLLGRRMPDLDLDTADGPARVFTLLHAARPLLINLDGGTLDISAWSDRVRSIDARYEGMWELPAIGLVPAPSAVLVRPDGYVAWVGDSTPAGLVEALATWF